MVKALAIAVLFLGMHEQVDFADLNKALNWPHDVRSTAWCAAFVNMALERAGLPSGGTLLARGYLKWGQAVTKPQKGDIVVFSRGNKSWQGHVGFYIKEKQGMILVLGGNQRNEVSYAWYPADRVLGFRRHK